MEMMEMKMKVALLEQQQNLTEKMKDMCKHIEIPTIKNCQTQAAAQTSMNKVYDLQQSTSRPLNNQQDQSEPSMDQHIVYDMEAQTKICNGPPSDEQTNTEPINMAEEKTEGNIYHRVQRAQQYMNRPTLYIGIPVTNSNQTYNLQPCKISREEILEEYYNKYPSQREVNEKPYRHRMKSMQTKNKRPQRNTGHIKHKETPITANSKTPEKEYNDGGKTKPAYSHQNGQHHHKS